MTYMMAAMRLHEMITGAQDDALMPEASDARLILMLMHVPSADFAQPLIRIKMPAKASTRGDFYMTRLSLSKQYHFTRRRQDAKPSRN